MTDAGNGRAGSAAADAPHGIIARAGRDLRHVSDSYGLVFLLIVATLFATALLGDVRWGRLATATMTGVTLLVTFRASRVPGGRGGRAAAVAVVALLAVAAIAAVLGSRRVNELASMAIAAVFVIAASAAIVRRLRFQTSITMRTVMGALCIYLFIGLFFAVAYGAVDIADDGAFFAQTDAPSGDDFVYFSFITQATVGYGDLSPITDLGKMLAITEALLGQVYLVTIVAVLVGNLGRARAAGGLVAGPPRGHDPDGAGPAPAAPVGAAPSGSPDPFDDGA